MSVTKQAVQNPPKNVGQIFPAGILRQNFQLLRILSLAFIPHETIPFTRSGQRCISARIAKAIGDAAVPLGR